MLDVNGYTEKLIAACRAVFRERLLYVGLQGSYLRGEAKENSDIDIMVVLDQLSVNDMDAYRDVLEQIGHREKSCGFLCGRAELACWTPLEVCQLRHTTKDLFGFLSEYLPEASREDEIRYVQVSLGNLYHELCHRYIHADREKNAAKFRTSCKALFFLIQNLYYLENGDFLPTRKALKELVSEEDRLMLTMAWLPDDYDFDSAFSSVFQWCQKAFRRTERIAQQQSGGAHEREDR